MVSLRANQFMFIICRMEIMLMVVHCVLFMGGSRKFCQGGGGGPTVTFLFLVDEGWEHLNTSINGPSSARQRNAI